jgi:hypothetical protein
MDAVGQEARKEVDTFDKINEAKLIAQDAQVTVATSLAIEAGAVGLGALVAVLATTAAIDVTGILSAGLIAVLGLFIIPIRRNVAKRELNGKISEMRTRLLQSLIQAFDKEATRSQGQIREAVAPYSRFVRAESSKFNDALEQLGSIARELDRLKGSVEEI